MQLLTFDEALSDSNRCKKRHVMLGNGFSIACRPGIFAYGKLFEQADFALISPRVKRAFEALGTQDFEKVIRLLRDSAVIAQVYGASAELVSSLRSDADGLRELLVQTIAASHPAWPGEISDSEYSCCRRFLAHFDTVYTLNYDLLLYWAQMHTPDGKQHTSDDGFRASDRQESAEYVVWEADQSHKQNTWFLHGALHVFDSGTEVQKYTWSKTGIRLIDQIREALNRGYFPIFVSEGSSDEKYERIRHSDYLAKAYRSFSSITGALFIYGHSLAENDNHFLRCIQRGKISNLYVGVYGDPDSPANMFIRRRAESLASARRTSSPLQVTYFDAASAKVWAD